MGESNSGLPSACLSRMWGPPVGWPLLHFQMKRGKGPALQVHSLAPPSRTSAREEVQHSVLPGTCFSPFLLLTSHQNQKGWSFFSPSFLTPSYIIYSTFHWSYLTCSFLWSYKVGGKGRRGTKPPILKRYQDWMIYIRMRKWILSAGKSKDIQLCAED